MKLIIVESPTKAKTLSRFLPEEYQAIASMGHIRDLPSKKLSVDIEKDFEPTYKVVPGKRKTISKLKKKASQARQIILATDPDREGEAIAYHVNFILKNSKKVTRITFHEITKQAIERALEKPGEIDKKLFHAQQARRILDRLVGYKLSPLLWVKIRRGLSAGRVQSPALRLIVEREKEIKAFNPEEYWKIKTRLETKKKKSFTADLVKIEKKKLDLKNKQQSEQVEKDLKKADFKVLKVSKREYRKAPPPPFITSTLQRKASWIYHWSAKKTIYQAQRLYEKGLITYHRTDSVNLSKSALNKARKYIKDKYGEKWLAEKPRRFKVKSKLAQEAHEAIRVTDVSKEYNQVKQKMGNDAGKLYSLIFNRFIASQMKKNVYQRMIVDIEAEGKQKKYLLKAKGKKEVFSGWKKIYQAFQKEKEKYLPELKEEEKVSLLKVIPEQKFTQPPPRYTEGSLIRALEKRGIGRPSTYASIISTIQSRHYVEKDEGKFQATPVGITVNDFLMKYFEKIVDYDFTAEMENDLDKIAQGKKKWVPVVADFWKPFYKKLKKVKKNAKRQKIKAKKIGKKCPQCKKGEQVIRVGKYGKFLSCSRFPDCKWKANYLEKLKGVECPKCGGAIVKRRTRKGKKFYGCENWPKCKWASWRKPKDAKS